MAKITPEQGDDEKRVKNFLGKKLNVNDKDK